MAQHGSPAWVETTGIIQISLGAFMWLLIVLKFVRESFQMYKVTRRFRLSRYMNILVTDGMIYFLVYVYFSFSFVSPLLYTKLTVNSILIATHLHLLYAIGILPQDGWWQLPVIAQIIPLFMLLPRFILNLRAHYARDLRGRHGSDIDAAFGATSTFDAVINMTSFVDSEQNEGQQ